MPTNLKEETKLRVHPVTPDKASGQVKEIYHQLEKKMGKVINIFHNMGNSLPVLQAFVALNEAASQTKWDPKAREQIALVVGQTNQCNYCLSAHTAVAHQLHISDQDILNARKGLSDSPKVGAALKFAKAVVEKRGKVTEQEVADLKAAGVDDQELTELLLLINVNLFTNYFNIATDTKVDFPLAPPLK